MRLPLRGAAALILLLLAAGLFGCGQHDIPPRDPQLAIELRWVKGYPAETRAKVETGLNWALSFLGASLPKHATPYFWNGDRVRVDLDAAGVLPQTRPAWITVLNALKNSEEYHKTGAIDIGRFLMLTLCSSYQYFALTGTAPTYADFLAKHPQVRKPAAIVESDIAYGNRLLEVSEAARIQDINFVAYEGSGSIAASTFQKAEIETIDFMPNGQLRFALYDLQGNPKASATPALTAAGKPSNCLWCHEIRLQRPYRNVTSVPGYYSAAEFTALIAQRMSIVDQYRRTLDSQIDFTRTADHTYAELLYLSFAEPSLERVAREWGMSASAVKARLASLPTHRQQEFSYLGEHLYERAAIDPLAPYQVLPVPSHVRAASAYEPDLIHAHSPP
jgi:hypothetical protein